MNASSFTNTGSTITARRNDLDNYSEAWASFNDTDLDSSLPDYSYIRNKGTQKFGPKQPPARPPPPARPLPPPPRPATIKTNSVRPSEEKSYGVQQRDRLIAIQEARDARALEQRAATNDTSQFYIELKQFIIENIMIIIAIIIVIVCVLVLWFR